MARATRRTRSTRPCPTWPGSAPLGLLAALSVLAPVPGALAAQDPGTVEVGLFAQRTAFDESTTLAFGTSPGLGGHAGLFVWPNLVLEASAAYTWTHPAEPPRVGVSHVPLRLGARYQVPVTEAFHPFVGASFVRNGYADAVEGSDNGLGGVVGMKTYLDDRFAFRADLHVDRVSAPFNAGTLVSGTTVRSHTNWSLRAGISMDLGPGRSKDSDGDGVRDRDDLCPATIPGVAVDMTGCRLDEDGDGIFDEDDLCPLTPPGVAVDGTGCRLDGDRDRVFDEDDRCPATPAGVRVDPEGCAIDTDQDRVPDHVDECPGTPVGVAVGSTGCRVDSDDDGVWDEDDRCPNTAAGIEVDEQGCQILFVEEEEVPLILEGVTFETASAVLTPEARTVLDGIAAALVANPDIRVRVSGHTDATGERAYNLVLSQERAESVVRHLAEQGVRLDRMEAQGFGPDQPIATNATPDGRQANRRVELSRIDP